MPKQLKERFLTYVQKNTRSDEHSDSVPSTSIQTDFLKDLVEELKQLGFSDVKLNPKNSFVTATVPSNVDHDVPTVGFIAHVDTADFESENVQPQIHENYDGKDIILNEAESIILSPDEFPNLRNYLRQTLITTDGTTLLGSDDKSGVAEIVTACSQLLEDDSIKHGKIRVAFGPDEEIGRGADLFDVEDFDCDFAYTVDGGPVGELSYESFNAAQAVIKIHGKNVHPGSAKNTMVSALEISRQFQNALPRFHVPENTSDRQGFFHLVSAQGTVDYAELVYIIRDHDMTLFEAKKAYIENAAEELNHLFESERVQVSMKDQYYNMAEIIEKDFTSVDIAKEAMNQLNIDPIIEPTRGGTDGSKISFMGLPTPNLFAGGENFHGRYEFVSLEAMEKSVQVIKKIAELTAQ